MLARIMLAPLGQFALLVIVVFTGTAFVICKFFKKKESDDEK